MKATPGDMSEFEKWLEALADSIKKEQPSAVPARETEVTEATIAFVLQHFHKAKEGVLGKTCACGRPGEVIHDVQPCPHWPREKYVFCINCSNLIGQYNHLMKQVMEKDKT